MLKKQITENLFSHIIMEAVDPLLGAATQTVKHANSAFAVGDRVYIYTMEKGKEMPRWKTVKYVADDYSYLVIEGFNKNIEPSNQRIITTDTWNMAIERMRKVCPEDFNIGMVKVDYVNYRGVRHVVLTYRSYKYSIPYDELRNGSGEMVDISKDTRHYFLNQKTGDIIATTNDQGNQNMVEIPNRDWVARDSNGRLALKKSEHNDIKQAFDFIDDIVVNWVNNMGIGIKMKFSSQTSGGWIIWKGNPAPVYTSQHNGYMVPTEWVESKEGTRNVLVRDRVSGEKSREDIDTQVFVAWKWKYRHDICAKFPWLYDTFSTWIANGEIKKCRPKRPATTI